MSRRTREAATSPDWPEALGLALRDWRRGAKLTQAAAARSCGVSRSTWCRWEGADPGRPVHLSPLVRGGVPLVELVSAAAKLCGSDRVTGRYAAP